MHLAKDKAACSHFAQKAKGTPYMLYKYPRVPNFTPFCSTIARFPDIKVFDFSIGYNGEFAIFEKKNL